MQSNSFKAFGVFSALSLIFMVSAAASTGEKADPRFIGSFELKNAQGEGADRCPQELRVRDENDAVEVDAGWASERFEYADKHTHFTSSEISRLEKGQESPFGFVQTRARLSLTWFKRMIYQKDTTSIPLGFTGLGKDDDFNCIYKRIENN